MNLIRQHKVCFIALLLLLLLSFHLAILDNHGFNKDSWVEMVMARNNIDLVRLQYMQGNFADPAKYIRSNLGYYGTFFNLVAYFFQYLALGSDFPLTAASHTVKLVVLAFFYVAGSGGLALCLWAATRSVLWSALSMLVLELMPVYFGYATNDVKDIPFAVMFTLASAALAFTITRLNETTRFTRASIIPAMLAGLFIGLAASVRMPGVMLGLHAALVYALMHWLRHRKLISLQLVGSGMLLALSAFITIWIIQPVAWPNPVGWMRAALDYMAHHPHHAQVLTDGIQTESMDAPLYYMLNWLLAPLPLVWIFCTALGLFSAIRMARQSAPLAQCVVLLMLLQLGSIPLMAVLAKSNLYDGVRHLLFIYPAIAFFATLGIRQASLFRPAPLAKIACSLIALAATDVAWEMWQIHPYEHSYFNALARHERMLDYWRIDIWAFADKETAEWLNTHAPHGSNVYYVPHASGQLEAFGRPDLHIQQMYHPVTQAGAYYVVLFSKDDPYYHQDARYASCELAHSVQRPLGAVILPLAQIYYCTSHQMGVMVHP